MWRTFCVNYEARTSAEDPRKKAKRKLKNYKLKHSRLLTCYSALAYLLAIFQAKKTVSIEDAKAMVNLSPTDRLEWLGTHVSEANPHVGKIISHYEDFLNKTGQPEEKLLSIFLDKTAGRDFVADANNLGDLVANLIEAVGKGSKFYRMLIV